MKISPNLYGRMDGSNFDVSRKFLAMRNIKLYSVSGYLKTVGQVVMSFCDFICLNHFILYALVQVQVHQ